MNHTHDANQPHTAITSAASPDAAGTTIWDLPLRLFHWSLVAVVATAVATGFLMPPWWLDVHVYAGYGLAVLLAFRLAWGLVGSRFSRFQSFELSLPAVWHHVRSLRGKASANHAGHNPLGAWMIVVLLALLGGLVASGVVLLAGQEKLGPLAGLVGFHSARPAKELHEFLAWALIGAVCLHVIGVLVETVVLRHPVVRAMINGKKNVVAVTMSPVEPATSRRGALVFGLSLAALVGGGGALAVYAPAPDPAVKFPAVYQTECGSCHAVYHPSLRTAATWQTLMAGLADHYGEDASIDTRRVAEISTFLSAHGAETFDTEASWRIGRAETASLRMTDTRYWKRRHRDITDVQFRARTVGSKLNCNGCHSDAASGRFADQQIKLPDGVRK